MTAGGKDASRLKMRAGAASSAMLLAISSYNVLPTLNRAFHGEVAAIGLAVVQIAFTVILAIIPFVPGWDAKTRFGLTVAFMLVNGYFAYENAGHRHDDERTAFKQHNDRDNELAQKKIELGNLGKFTDTDDSQVAIAQTNATSADTASIAARTAANTAQTQFAVCKRSCDKLKSEAQRLEGYANQKETDAKTAHDKLVELSGRRTLTTQARPIKERIDQLNHDIQNETAVSDTSSNSTIEALFIAAVIELGNRFGPEAIFKFIFFAAGVPLLLSSSPSEAVQGQSGPPGPNRAPRKTRKSVEPVQGGATVISMNRSRAPQDYRSMSALERSKAVAQFRDTGMSQREIAVALGWSKSAVQRAQDDADEAQGFKPGPIHAVA